MTTSTARRRTRPKPLKYRLMLLLGTTFFTLLLGEVILRVAGFRPLVVRQTSNLTWDHDRQLGWRMQPNQQGEFRTKQFAIDVRVNSKGLRDEESDYVRNGRKRVLVLGDSFAWGWGVEERQRFSEVLETDIENLEVLNAGMVGYGTDQQLIWLREEGLRYRPDAIILVVCGNDPRDNVHDFLYEKYYKPVFCWDAEGDSLSLRNSPVRKSSLVVRTAYHLRRWSALGNLVGLLATKTELNLDRRRKRLPDLQWTQQRPVELTVDLIDLIQQDAEKNGAVLFVVTTDIYWPEYQDGDYRQMVARIRSLGISVTDIAAGEGYDEQTMQIPHDRHWNAAGHRFVAQQLAPAINALLTP